MPIRWDKNPPCEHPDIPPHEAGVHRCLHCSAYVHVMTIEEMLTRR